MRPSEGCSNTSMSQHPGQKGGHFRFGSVGEYLPDSAACHAAIGKLCRSGLGDSDLRRMGSS